MAFGAVVIPAGHQTTGHVLPLLRHLPAGPGPAPRADAPPRGTVVVHEALANLSKLPPELVDLVEGWCRGKAPKLPDPSAAEAALHLGPCYGLLAGLHALARELELVRAVGERTRLQRLALYLIYARVAFQGSRFSAVRAAEDHAVREILGVGRFDEDDLYAAVAGTVRGAGDRADGRPGDDQATGQGGVGGGALPLRDGADPTANPAAGATGGVPLGLTVADAIARLKGVRLVCLGERETGLWRLARSYPEAQRKVLAVLPKLRAPVLSLEKPVRRRLNKRTQPARSQ